MADKKISQLSSASAPLAGTEAVPVVQSSTTVQTPAAAFAVGPYAFKNRIINGAMQIAQRGTTATITAGDTIANGYSTVDRFYVYCTGANVTADQVAGSGAVKNNLQITGAASVTEVGVGQRIEQLNCYDMAGSTATLSVNMSNSLLTTVTWTAYYANTANTFGTLASPTRTQIATGTFTVTSTLTNYSTQISIPAAATTGIEIVFTVGAQTSGTWVIGNVQLERSSVVTAFDYRSAQQELALCFRYFQNVAASRRWVIYAAFNDSFFYYIPIPQMRAAPTVLNLTSSAYGGTFGIGVTTTDSVRYDITTGSATGGRYGVYALGYQLSSEL